ncbi:hypothetical protein [Ruminococcus albus]|uniref:hypothetical protein n=1 Tax=Ruminococcus albus TaxID=1264 RepID=UPI00046561AA|nr:hypothetical protein [Ruminococcus albus]
MIYAFEYNVSGIGNHPFSGHHISRLTADNDEDAIERIKSLRNEIMKEFSDFPIEFSITFVYKELEADKSQKLINTDLKEIKETKSSNNISCDLAKIIDYVADNEKDEESTILKLIEMGFTGESLVDHFGFNIMTVSEVVDELYKKDHE